MSLLSCYSFDDDMTLARIIDKLAASINASGRTGKCLRLSGGAQNNGADMYATLPFPSTTATVTIGFAFKPASGSNASSDGVFLGFRHLASAVTHIFCYHNRTNGVVTAMVGATVIGTSAAGAVVFDQWNYVEARILVADSGGTFELRVNGTAVISFTGDTRNGGATANIDCVRIYGRNGTTHDYDDLYVLDNTGSENTTFLGDVAIECLRPNGNGNSSQWVGSDGNSTDNYQLVDDTTVNVSDYVQSSTSGHKDTYAYSDLTATTGTIAAVQVVSYVAKTPGTALSVQQVARSGGTETAGAPRALGGWVPITDVFEVKPGSGAWTISDVNAAEFGIQVA